MKRRHSSGARWKERVEGGCLYQCTGQDEEREERVPGISGS